MNSGEPIRIELPCFEGMTVNAWLLKGEENILIDCGEKSEASMSALQKGLAIHHLKIHDIDRVIITHAHYDHIGMAYTLAKETGAKIWVSEMVHGWGIQLEDLLVKRSAATQEVFKKYIHLKALNDVEQFTNDMILPYWDPIPDSMMHVFPMFGHLDLNGKKWEIIHSPGHCLNQTCFYCESEGWLLSADMLLPMIPLPIIDAKREAPYGPVKSLLMHVHSYDLFNSLKINKVFPGHTEAFEDAHELINRQKDKILSKKHQCLSLIKAGSMDFMDLYKVIYPNRQTSMPRVFMVIGLLEMLEEEDLIHIEFENKSPKIMASLHLDWVVFSERIFCICFI